MVQILGENFSRAAIILALATAVGGFGGFPAPPRVFSRLSSSPLVQHALLFTLIWQGGGKQNMKFAAMITVAIFLATQVLDMVY